MSHMVTLTPMGGGYGNIGSSVLKSVSFFLLYTGIIFVIIGYLQQEKNNVPPKVEYRYVPKTFEEKQANNTPISSNFKQMFSERGPWEQNNGFVDSYPWQRQLISSKIVQPDNNPKSGFGKAVGFTIV